VRISLKISSNKERIVLPLDYNYHVQSFLYNNVSPELASFLHDRGFLYGQRSFKMFTFSRLLGKYEMRRAENAITFSMPLTLIISSPMDRFVSELANSMLKKGDLKLCGENIFVEEIAVLQEPEIESRMGIRVMTPLGHVQYSSHPRGKEEDVLL